MDRITLYIVNLIIANKITLAESFYKNFSSQQKADFADDIDLIEDLDLVNWIKELLKIG